MYHFNTQYYMLLQNFNFKIYYSNNTFFNLKMRNYRVILFSIKMQKYL